MLSAVSALIYHASATLRLEAYLGAFFPLPIVLATSRWGPAATLKTLVRAQSVLLYFSELFWRLQTATCLLLLLLGGPLRAAVFLLMHGAPFSRFCNTQLTIHQSLSGALGVSIGLLWHWRCPWMVSLPVSALVRSRRSSTLSSAHIALARSAQPARSRRSP
jgi:hypothetical protein